MTIHFLQPKPRHIPLIIIGIALLVCSVGLVLTFLQEDAYVVGGNIYLSPLNAAVRTGTEVSVIVRITPGTRVDTVTASVSYDADTFSYKKAEYVGSPFTSQIPAILNDGVVTVQSARLGGETIETDSLISTLVFTAKKDSASFPELVYGNAAYVGRATYPTIAGKVVYEAANPLALSTRTVSQGAGMTAVPAVDTDSTSVFPPLTALLKDTGMSEQTAQRVAPWLAGAMLCCILAVFTVAAWFVYEYYHKRKRHKGVKI